MRNKEARNAAETEDGVYVSASDTASRLILILQVATVNKLHIVSERIPTHFNLAVESNFCCSQKLHLNLFITYPSAINKIG